ncbi:cyclase family protein [Baekduia sp. Peel2402]|uniref:cyclase family protein n=1 Tax=Baekduia sp. Peel2402 TaxID=3458296 RepID=UPI00403EB706
MLSSRSLLALAAAALAVLPATAAAHGRDHGHGSSHSARSSDLWRAYDQALAPAKYIDLTHDLTPGAPVWKGFGPAQFLPAVNPETGNAYTYASDGFEATSYVFSTDQFGTQLDPPAHWAPEYPAIDEIPSTYAVRKLVVISIAAQVAKDPAYSLSVKDIKSFERRYGKIPAGSVVFVRSDWSKRWTDDPEAAKVLAADPAFPGVSLDALKYLHEKRHILFHGHEPLDTDTTPTLEGEAWLMHHGYAQAEGVANLDGVPPTGCLVNIGFPKLRGGLGGYARYVAICPPSTTAGTAISAADAPLAAGAPLHWDATLGYRVR